MVNSIPASDIVTSTPSVLTAGGQAINLVGLLLTTSAYPPIGSVQSFGTQAAVAAYFGAGSTEAALATIYFNGFDNSNQKPAQILFAQYNQIAVPAYLRGANISALPLASLQAVNGNLTVVMDGFSRTGAVNLSAASSFSAGAATIQTALNGSLALLGSMTASIATGTMTVSAVTSGTLTSGMLVVGTGVSSNTYITGQLTGAVGGTGTYSVNNSQSVVSGSMTLTPVPVAVTYDNIPGAYIITSGIPGPLSAAAFATGGTGTTAFVLALTLATGAVISQGAAAATPAAFMTALVAGYTNFVSWMTVFNPDVSGNTNKEAFATWNAGQNSRYMYAAWDTDASPTTTVPAASSLGVFVQTGNLSGVCPIYSPAQGPTIAAFICGAIASVNTSQTNGRTNFFGKGQSGIQPDVTSITVAQNLRANGYNFYGIWGTGAQNFNFFDPGSVGGPFLWLDSFINQVWMNNTLQAANLSLLTNTFSIPYNQQGKSLIQAAAAGPIQAFLNFGAIRIGVILSPAQVANVNNNAGANIAPTLQNFGYYYQVQDASPTVRAARGSPPCTLWYTDGQSVQKINVSSVQLQ